MKYLASQWTHDDFAGLRTLVVPSGIGEFQWAMAKYVNQPEPLGIIALDGAPRRLHQFAELHPIVKVFGYCTYDYSQICHFQKYHGLDTWKAVTERFELGQPVMLACNPHLEAGRPLAEWLPDLETSYHYDVVTEPTHRGFAHRYNLAQPLIGLSCASYRGASAWRTWEMREWLDLLRRIHANYPELRFALMGGAWDDLTSEVFEAAPELPWLVDDLGLPPVGRTRFGAAIEMMRYFRGFIGFSSGIGHVAQHTCNVPNFMLWPDFQEPLSRAWVNPSLLESGQYVAQTWAPVDIVYPKVAEWLERILR